VSLSAAGLWIGVVGRGTDEGGLKRLASVCRLYASEAGVDWDENEFELEVPIVDAGVTEDNDDVEETVLDLDTMLCSLARELAVGASYPER
jgi:hypothetical protein